MVTVQSSLRGREDLSASRTNSGIQEVPTREEMERVKRSDKGKGKMVQQDYEETFVGGQDGSHWGSSDSVHEEGNFITRQLRDGEEVSDRVREDSTSSTAPSYMTYSTSTASSSCPTSHAESSPPCSDSPHILDDHLHNPHEYHFDNTNGEDTEDDKRTLKIPYGLQVVESLRTISERSARASKSDETPESKTISLVTPPHFSAPSTTPISPGLHSTRLHHPAVQHTDIFAHRQALQRSPSLNTITPASLAPPTLSSTSTLTTISPIPPRIHRRSSSASTGRSMRLRSGSFTTSSPPTGRSASPAISPSARYLDPDQHWLSEDEARGNSSGTHRPRRESVDDRIGGHGDSSDGGAGSVGGGGSKQTPGINNFNATQPPLHKIHHRPSPLLVAASDSRPSSPRSTLLDPPLRQTLPLVISLLTCRSCHRLLHDPTTLACGHSICLTCSLPPSSLRPSDPEKVGQGIIPSESQFARNPSSPLPTGPPLARTLSNSTASSLLTGLINSISHPPPSVPEPSIQPSRSVSSITRGRPMCPHESCSGKVSSLAEPKPDFVLQKILEILKTQIVGLEEEVNRDHEGWDSLEELSDVETVVNAVDVVRPVLERTLSGSDASIGSNDGGGQDPLTVEAGKRAHKVREWTSSKRPRRKSLRHGPATRTNRLEDMFDFDRRSTSLLSEIQSELECQVCVQLLNDPITTPCGHTYCQACLSRSLDHSDKCPLCRADFPSFSYFKSHPGNNATTQLIDLLFSSQILERKRALAAEEQTSALDTPIFVCTLAWPNLPAYIHIFEPRYRLMMRRVMEGNRQFGMVLPSRHGGGLSEYGTMLEVQSWNMIEDGRSIVETVGTYRFRLLEKDTFDGYTVGRIERVDDVSPEQEAELERIALARNPVVPRGSTPSTISLAPAPVPGSSGNEASRLNPAIELSTADLMNVCLEFVQTLRTGSAPWVLQRLNNTIGPMPTDPSDFSFWMAEVMPVDDHVKATLLQITSPRERLRLLVFWVEQFRSSWWFSRGCSVM